MARRYPVSLSVAVLNVTLDPLRASRPTAHGSASSADARKG